MDRGWSWVVCAAVFFSHLLVIGFCYSIGVYYVEFLTVFGQSKGTTALISSLNFGALSFIGLSNNYTDRQTDRHTMSRLFCWHLPSQLKSMRRMNTYLQVRLRAGLSTDMDTGWRCLSEASSLLLDSLSVHLQRASMSFSSHLGSFQVQFFFGINSSK